MVVVVFIHIIEKGKGVEVGGGGMGGVLWC